MNSENVDLEKDKILGDYALFASGGKQHIAQNGRKVVVEKIDHEPGEEVKFCEVLFVRTGERHLIGKPALTGATIIAKVTRHLKDPKVISFKKRRRKGYTKKIGHRQQKTELVIESINC